MSATGSFFANLFDRLRHDASVEYTHYRLEGPPADAPAIQSGTQYLRVWLRSARITEVRRWTSKFHASVHARFELNDPVQGRRELVCVVAPDKTFSELDPSHLDRLIVVNQPLLGPVPYRGQLDADIGLFSIAASDLAKPYLELLAGLTDAAGVSFLAKAVPWAEPIRRGAEMLFSEAGRAQLEIGLARTEARLSPGHWVVARVPKGEKLQGLHLDPHDYGLLDAKGRPVAGFPYMVIGVEALDQRDDYAAIPEIRTGWEAVRSAVTELRPDAEVQQRFDQLRRVIAVSQDLVPADKRRIAQIFASELHDAGYGLDALTPAAMPHTLESRAAGLPQRHPLPGADALLTTLRMREAPVEEQAATVHHADCDASDPDDQSAMPAAAPHAARAALEAAPRPWRLATSLQRLRGNVDALAPLRSKRSDGSIGDAAHASRDSDHNPWVEAGGKGIVTAIDITHDPANGCDAARLAESLREASDPRVKYVIWNRRIFSATVQAWQWRPYGGSNPHDHHMHISVQAEPGRFDDATDWQVTV
ncbi:hypothetical protein BH10PSE18_BH10PSE18_47880 [soil metagenome]